MTDDELRTTLTNLAEAIRRDAWAYRAKGESQRAQDADNTVRLLQEALDRKATA